MFISSTSTDVMETQMQIADARTTTTATSTAQLQMLLHQEGLSSTKHQLMQALQDAAEKVDTDTGMASPQQLSVQASSNGEKKKHAFWATQVSNGRHVLHFKICNIWSHLSNSVSSFT
jgi:uncharacterized membrane protein